MTSFLFIGLLFFLQPPDVASLANEATRLLARDGVTFDEAAATADRLQAAMPNVKDAEPRGRIALLWVRAMRRALIEIPMTADRDREPFAGWRQRHEADIVYSEPAGQWLIAPDVLWKMHDGMRATASAEPMAWQAVENGLPGECEGYPPCYLSGFTMLHGRYLQEHPKGAHVEPVVVQILESLDQIERLLNERNGHELFDPKTGCDDLTKAAAALNAQLTRVGERQVIAAEIAKLTKRCGK